MNAQEKWLVGTVVGAVASAIITPIIKEVFDQYRCLDCGALMVT